MDLARLWLLIFLEGPRKARKHTMADLPDEIRGSVMKKIQLSAREVSCFWLIVHNGAAEIIPD